MQILIKLILAHLIGDFLLQRSKWVAQKEKLKGRSPYLYAHVLIHAVLVFLLVGEPSLWYLAVYVAVVHFFIDLSKITFQKPENSQFWFFFDQALHLISLYIGYLWVNDFEIHAHMLTEHQWLLITAFLFVSWPASMFIQFAIAHWTPPANDETAGLKKAGTFIGILERLFVLTFILSSHWEAIGFLLAAKSVFRYNDIKDARSRQLTEYVLIGTLLSFGLAMGVGLLVSHLT